MNDRSPTMSWLRALGLAAVGIALIAGLTNYNDATLRNTMLIGNHLPISVFGALIVFLLTVNLGLHWLRPAWTFSGFELAIALALVLAVCSVPGSGLLRTVPQALMMPHHQARVIPGWRENGVLNYVPPEVLADGSDETEVNRYLVGDQGVGGVPWHLWRGPLLVWLPIVLCIWVALIGLAMVVHPQWSKRELLPYPIIQFTDALLPSQERSSAFGAVFRSRLFWIGAVTVFGIHFNNFLVTVLESNAWVEIPLTFKMATLFKAIAYRWVPGWFGDIHLYFAVIAFAFLLASEVSLSVGIAPFLYFSITLFLSARGVNMNMGGHLDSQHGPRFMAFGAFLGMFAMILYAGRRHFSLVAKRAVGLGRATAEVEGTAITGLRMAALGLVGATLSITIGTGLDWQLAAIFVALLLIGYLVMGRIMAETGLFFNAMNWYAGPIIVGFFGSRAIGPEAICMLYLLSTMLMIDPREALMPFLMNGMRLAEHQKVRVMPLAGWTFAALIAALGIALFVTLTAHYRDGVPYGDPWGTNVVPAAPFRAALQESQRLEAQDLLAESRSVQGFDRLSEVRLNKTRMTWMTIGVVLIIFTAVGRMRWQWWPLHPVLFLVWTNWPVQQFAWSFLIGWFLKVLVNRYGGAMVYQKAKPLMFGLIAGELLAGLLAIVSSLLYVYFTGDKLPPFRILPE